MANRHQIYIWEATQADLSKGFYELSTKAISYVRKEKQPSKNLLAFAEALHQHRKNVDYSRLFFKEVAEQIKNTTTKAIMIEFWEEEDWKRPLRDLVKLAQNYQVIIVDTEITMVFFPTGEIKPFGAEYDWEELLGELSQADNAILAYKESNLPSTPTAYAKWMRNLLDKELGQYGFTLVKTDIKESVDLHESWYCRDVEIGKQYIHFRHGGKFPDFSSDDDCYMECNAVSDIYKKFNFCLEGKIFSTNLECFRATRYLTDFPFSEHETHYFINEVKDYMIKPILNKTTDIKGLDNFVNGWLSKQPLSYIDIIKNPPPSQLKSDPNRSFSKPDTYNSLGSYCALILARLVNPEYRKLKTFFDVRFESGRNYINNSELTEWQKLEKYLEEEINPETFWQQYGLAKAEEKRLENERIQQLITQFKLNPEQEKIPVSDQWYDAKENLIWQRCCMGEHWQNGQITGIAELMNWDKMNEYINQFKDAGWRLPTRQELENLSFTKKIGYITQKGFDFYEQAEVSFPVHWIEPHKPYGISHRADICILSTSPHGGTSKFMDDSNLVAYLRLVKSVT